MIAFWFILTLVFIFFAILVRMINKEVVRFMVLWAIKTGSGNLDEIVQKTGLREDQVEDLIEDLMIEGRIEKKPMKTRKNR